MFLPPFSRFFPRGFFQTFPILSFFTTSSLDRSQHQRLFSEPPIFTRAGQLGNVKVSFSCFCPNKSILPSFLISYQFPTVMISPSLFMAASCPCIHFPPSTFQPLSASAPFPPFPPQPIFTTISTSSSGHPLFLYGMHQLHNNISAKFWSVALDHPLIQIQLNLYFSKHLLHPCTCSWLDWHPHFLQSNKLCSVSNLRSRSSWPISKLACRKRYGWSLTNTSICINDIHQHLDRKG